MNRKRNSREWEEILESFKKSGKSQASFCKENNIPLSTLQYHLLRRKKGDRKNDLVKVPFTVERSEKASLQIKTDYCKIEFWGHIEEDELMGILRSLKAVSA